MSDNPYCRFVVGQKVVCVRDNWSATIKAHWNCPKAGEVYTIRDIGPHHQGSGKPSIRLVEITNGLTRGYISNGVEPNFWVARFRPIHITSTDAGMAILRKAVTDVWQNNKVPA
jgi:hypothetical protein